MCFYYIFVSSKKKIVKIVIHIFQEVFSLKIAFVKIVKINGESVQIIYIHYFTKCRPER
jgi:hypothetical protein